MNKNALRVEMGIPLLAHPKHTYSKIGGITDSESEYSSDPKEQLDDLIQYSKQVESMFDQDFDRFMNGLENFEPFDDLEEWSDNVELFMDAMAKPTKYANALSELAKLKKEKVKAPEQSNDLIYDKS